MTNITMVYYNVFNENLGGYVLIYFENDTMEKILLILKKQFLV